MAFANRPSAKEIAVDFVKNGRFPKQLCLPLSPGLTPLVGAHGNLIHHILGRQEDFSKKLRNRYSLGKNTKIDASERVVRLFTTGKTPRC